MNSLKMLNLLLRCLTDKFTESRNSASKMSIQENKKGSWKKIEMRSWSVKNEVRIKRKMDPNINFSYDRQKKLKRTLTSSVLGVVNL